VRLLVSFTAPHTSPESRSLAQVKHRHALRAPQSDLCLAQCRFWHARLQYRTLLQPWHQGLTLVHFSAQPKPFCHCEPPKRPNVSHEKLSRCANKCTSVSTCLAPVGVVAGCAARRARPGLQLQRASPELLQGFDGAREA